MDETLRRTADRIGFVAYALLVSGGRPDWNMILAEPREEGDGGQRLLRQTGPQDALTDTVSAEVHQKLVGG